MKSLFVFACLAALSMSVQAQFYGGDLDETPGQTGAWGYTSNTGAEYSYRSYDDFDHSGATITGVFANFLHEYDPQSVANYEIRSGMTTSSLGTLVASGINVAANFTSTGRSIQGVPEFQVMIDGLSTELAAGTYHLSIWLINPTQGSNANSYISVTTGEDVGPGGDPNPVPFGTPFNNGNALQRDMLTGDIGGLQDDDLSIGVITAPVPEPATLGVLGFGALALFRRRRK